MSISNVAKEQYALVTGGTRGIGYGISSELAKQRYHLVLGFNSDEERARQTKKELEEKYGVRVHTVKGDAAEESTINEYFQTIEKEFGNKLTALVHCAGQYLGITTPLESEFAQQMYQAQQAKQAKGDALVNLAAYDYFQALYPKCFFTCIERAVKLMEDGNGYIVGISSPGCNATMTPRVGYEISGHGKCVMEYLARHYAVRLAPRGITCNIICPGIIGTEAWDCVKEQFSGRVNLAEKVVQRTPMKRKGTPEEIGKVTAFLCSENGAFITGVVLPVDGGLHLT